MNRLGNVLTDAPFKVEQAFAGNPDAGDVVCQTGDRPSANYERHVKLDAVLMGLGDGTNQIGVEFVASVDAGAIWISLAPAVAFGTVSGRWANVRANADRDVGAGEVVRYGVRLSRIAGATGFSQAQCVVRLLTGNRNPSPAPDAQR
jgi:hypothetical protein